MDRFDKVKEILNRKKLDLALVTNDKNIRYFSNQYGVEFSCIFCIPSNDEPFILSSVFDKATLEESGIKTISVSSRLKADIKAKTLSEGLFKVMNKDKIKNIGTDAFMQPHSFFLKFNEKFKRLTDISEDILNIRSVKAKEEIDIISEAARISDRGMKAAYETIREGISELDIARAYENEVRKRCNWFSFETIVAAGKGSAEPHYLRYENKIKKSDFVVIDCGVLFNNYCTDMTRTFCLSPFEKQKKIYNIVLKAHDLAIEKARIGVRTSLVDKAARDFINKAGFKNNFTHSTGHGVGIEVHEYPSIGSMSKHILKENMVITVEPGIYIPNYGGVRIEDLCLITKNGIKILSNFSRKFKI